MPKRNGPSLASMIVGWLLRGGAMPDQARYYRLRRRWPQPLPHEGKQEIARRKRQIERGLLQVSP